MTGQIKLTGMVLTSMPVGDYDRRVTILTKERGKLFAFAKGARKPTSALLGCSQPFSFGEFTLYEGKSSYNIVSAEISNYFAELRDDMEAICYAMYFCEFCCYMTKENLEAGEPLKLLYMTLRALSKPALHKKLVRRIFELRFLAINGEMPQVGACVLCGREEMLKAEKAWFSAEEGGLLCEDCRQKRGQERGQEHGQQCRQERGQKRGQERKSLGQMEPFSSSVKAGWDDWNLPVGTSTIYTMQYILASPLEKLFTFAVSEEVLLELSRVMTKFLEKHVGHRMKSEEMLEVI